MSRAMIAQFSAVETLRPPNFSTTHGRVGIRRIDGLARAERWL